MQSNYHPSLAQESVRIVYSLLIVLLLPITFVHFLFQTLRRKMGYTRKRLSRYAVIAKPARVGGVLLHCASVGEVVAVQQLVNRILQAHPQLPITITTNTTTGAQRVAELFAGKVTHLYLPYDLGLFMGILLNKFKPRMVLINEMELWPNLVHSCWKQTIPVYLINARMSDKSLATYTKFPRLFAPMFAKFEAVCAQGQRDYDNYLALKIPSGKLILSNNIKFDMHIDENEWQTANQLRDKFDLSNRQLLVAGSTHDLEEQVLIEAYKQLVDDYPNLLLVIVPRHPQRFEKAFNICQKSGLSSARASDNQACLPTTQILLFDQMGMLRANFALAKIAFVGGSLADRGGHNALEPAAFGVPIVMGPHTYNNPAICQTLLDAGALYKVTDAQDIAQQCRIWLDNEEVRSAAGQAGKKVLAENGGAIDATLKVLGL
jgi:3-deoxy-D-manno-octulosonic-acid transferase